MPKAPRVSVILATARPDYPLKLDLSWHVFEKPAACLRAQTFTDFEWIVVDLLHARRAEWFIQHPQPFPVKHVTIKDNPWTPKGKRAAAASRNTGILYASGELLVFIDDSWSFPPDFLARYVGWAERGAFGAALYKTAEHPADKPRWNDPRTAYLVDGVCIGTTANPALPPTYGGLSMTREAAYRIGGYEELMDAGWGLEDVEIGYRLQAAGYPVVLDENLFVVTHQSEGLDPSAIRNPPVDTLCCETLVRLKLARIQAGHVVANTPAWTDEERAALMPCRYLRDGDICELYAPQPCPQPDSVRRPNADDPDAREALFGIPRGLRQ